MRVVGLLAVLLGGALAYLGAYRGLTLPQMRADLAALFKLPAAAAAAPASGGSSDLTPQQAAQLQAVAMNLRANSGSTILVQP